MTPAVAESVLRQVDDLLADRRECLAHAKARLESNLAPHNEVDREEIDRLGFVISRIGRHRDDFEALADDDSLRREPLFREAC